MNSAAGLISAGARKRRSSKRSRKRRERGLASATAANARRSYNEVQFPVANGWRVSMAEIKLEQLTKVYPDGTKAVDALDLEIADGELVVLVGPSGCGKTSALRMVAGLEDITAGRVVIGDRVVNRVPPKDRDIAMIFQNYALYPHMTAAGNMGFALKMRKTPREQIRRRGDGRARVLGLLDSPKKRPRTLSGG